MARQRRDLSTERRHEFLEAFRRSVRMHGLEGSSMRQVAAEAGVSQPLLMHHFGSRAGMVEALVDYVAEGYSQALGSILERPLEDEGTESLLQLLFGGAFCDHAERDQALFPELIATGVRDEHIGELVRKVFEGFQSGLVSLLRKRYPSAKAADCHRVAYGLVCLTEANEQFRSVSFTSRRNSDTLELARTLIETLET